MPNCVRVRLSVAWSCGWSDELVRRVVVMALCGAAHSANNQAPLTAAAAERCPARCWWVHAGSARRMDLGPEACGVFCFEEKRRKNCVKHTSQSRDGGRLRACWWRWPVGWLAAAASALLSLREREVVRVACVALRCLSCACASRSLPLSALALLSSSRLGAPLPCSTPAFCNTCVPPQVTPLEITEPSKTKHTHTHKNQCTAHCSSS